MCVPFNLSSMRRLFGLSLIAGFVVGCGGSDDDNSSVTPSQFGGNPGNQYRPKPLKDTIADFDKKSGENIANEAKTKDEQKNALDAGNVRLEIQRTSVDYILAGDSVTYTLPDDFECMRGGAWTAASSSLDIETSTALDDECKIKVMVPAELASSNPDNPTAVEYLGSIQYEGVAKDLRTEKHDAARLKYILDIRLAKSLVTNLVKPQQNQNGIDGDTELEPGTGAAESFISVVDTRGKINLVSISAFTRSQNEDQNPENILLLPKEITSNEPIIFNYTLPPVNDGHYQSNTLRFIQCSVGEFGTNVFGEPNMETKLALSAQEAAANKEDGYCPFRFLGMDIETGVFQLELKTDATEVDGRRSIAGLSKFPFQGGLAYLKMQIGVDFTRNGQSGTGTHLVDAQLALNIMQQRSVTLSHYQKVGETTSCQYFVSEGHQSFFSASRTGVNERQGPLNPYIARALNMAQSAFGPNYSVSTVEIRNQDEHDFLRQRVLEHFRKDRGYFINAFDIDNEGEWMTRTNETAEAPTSEPISYTNWAPGEPNNRKNREHCAAVVPDSNGLWNDVPCPKRFHHAIRACYSGSGNLGGIIE